MRITPPDSRTRLRPSDRPRPKSAALPLPGEHFESIERSHERCAAFGLSRIEAPAHDPASRADLGVMRERNLRLFTHAVPVMEMLLEQVVNTDSMVLLCDARGVVLHAVGDADFLERASKVALQPGVDWSEQRKGTNAIGTALINEAPTLVHADEHFMHANHFLTCSASPIFDPRGNMLGVLDVTGDQRSYHQHTMGLVRMSARMIENHWLADDFRQLMRLHFHARPEFIGTLMEGIVAVGPDGRLVGANRSALDLLRLSGAAVRMNSVTSLFSTTVGALVDHFRSPLAPPLALRLPNGAPVHAVARFNWSAAHGVGDPTTSAATAAPAVVHGCTTPSRCATSPGGLHWLETGDARMEAAIGKVRRVVDRDVPILLLGESGTGRQLLARAIHHDSRRAPHPFVAVDCSVIDEAALEAELFGSPGDAGGGRAAPTGRIAQAHGGTLFLEEIGELPAALQARLLRVLQERAVPAAGGGTAQPVDVAVIASSQHSLRDLIARGTFREALYYRLNGLVVKLPPLRERSDLDAIVRNILRAESPHGYLGIDDDVMALIRAYGWPGNVRELATVLRTAAIMAAGQPSIGRDHLSDDFLEGAGADLRARDIDANGGADPAAAPPSQAPVAADAAPRSAPAGGDEVAAQPAAQPAAAPVARPVSTAAGAPGAPPPQNAREAIAELELAMIKRALDEAEGNISVAARQLGISRNTIYRKLRWTVASGDR